MSKIEEKCKEKGVRLTDQRKIIAKVISDSKQTFGSWEYDTRVHWSCTAVRIQNKLQDLGGGRLRFRYLLYRGCVL